jgi:hypothetical protein
MFNITNSPLCISIHPCLSNVPNAQPRASWFGRLEHEKQTNKLASLIMVITQKQTNNLPSK